MREKSGGKFLKPMEEKELWEKKGLGDEKSREKLILTYRPLVYWLAKKFRVPYSSYPDLIQEGMVGLIAAVDNFDSARSNKFITYAYYKIKGRMANFLQRSEARAPIAVDEGYFERSDSFDADLDVIEWRVSLGDGLDKLPLREKDILKALVMEGRDVSEVACDYGVGVSHIYRLQRRAIEKLKNLFLKEDATSGS
ncbi:MAG: sigma-70 family RNA polymerase sigma factor [Synergistaceae bacterium]|nr:sigma-70 family RNA polymerase sigma factor [Synergistaceae bacterium]